LELLLAAVDIAEAVVAAVVAAVVVWLVVEFMY
jgi:hypothetical protein